MTSMKAITSHEISLGPNTLNTAMNKPIAIAIAIAAAEISMVTQRGSQE